MKKGLRISGMALALVLCLGFFAPAAQAAQTPATADISATVEVTGSDPKTGAEAVFRLSPITENAPMPGKPVKTISLKRGSNPVRFPVEFTRVGVYEYWFAMEAGDYFLPELDGRTYKVVVTVTNSADYTALEAAVRFYEKEGMEKLPELCYELPLRELTVVKKWADKDGENRPKSVQANLILKSAGEYADEITDQDAEKVLDTVTLRESNDWEHTWTGLDTRLGTYRVREHKVPQGYTVSYREDEDSGLWTIVNTIKKDGLIQTGQLNWPIPVLLALGGLLVLGGWSMLRKKEEFNG